MDEDDESNSGNEDDDEEQEEEQEEVALPGAVWQKKWNQRRVVEQLEKEEINRIIGAPAKSPEYLRRYTNTVTDIMQRLDPEKRKKYTSLAETWNNAGPPHDVQQRYVQMNCQNSIGSIFIFKDKR